MWRKVLTPTLLVINLWVGLGCMTTLYLHWQARLQARVLRENVEPLRAVAQMQDLLLRLQASTASAAPAPDAASRVEALLGALEQSLAASAWAFATPEEGQALEDLRERFAQYGMHVRQWLQAEHVAASAKGSHGPRLREDVAGLVALLGRLLEIEDRHLSQSKAAAQLYSWFHPFRLLMMVLGPALGIACGFWIARGFRRSIARISVTLSSTETGATEPVGLVTVGPADDLPALQRQVEAVGLRIRAIVEQLHQARQQLIRSERLASVGQLAAGLAHELRNPLTSVKLLIQTAARRGPAANLNERQLWVIQEEIARMESTIQGLLDFARPPLLDRARRDLRETIQRALSLVEGRAKQHQVSLRCDLPESPVEVDGDPAQIHQGCVNLLLNGIEATGQGGTLHVAVHAPQGSHDDCRIVFRDAGKGIPDGALERIFEPFVTTKAHGTGLGLAVSRRIAEEHGGTITAANHPDGGGEFTVVLPLSAGAHDPACSLS